MKGVGLPSRDIWMLAIVVVVVVIWTSRRLSKEEDKDVPKAEERICSQRTNPQKEEEEYFPIPQMRLSDFFPLEEEDDEEEDDDESGVARAKRGPRVAARSQQTRLSKSARCAVRACVRQSQKWRKILKTVFFFFFE